MKNGLLKLISLLLILVLFTCQNAHDDKVHEITYLQESLKGKIEVAELTYNIKVNYNIDSLNDVLSNYLTNDSIDVSILSKKANSEIESAIKIAKKNAGY